MKSPIKIACPYKLSLSVYLMCLSRALIGHGACHHGHWSPLHSLSLPGSVTSGDNYHIMPSLGDVEAHSTHSVSLVASLTPQEVVHLNSDSIIISQ